MVVYRPSCVLSDGGNEVSIGLNDHARIQIGVLIQEIDLPVNKGAQEVTFTKRTIRSGYCAPGKSRRFSVFTMGSLLISHTTCLNWYDMLENF